MMKHGAKVHKILQTKCTDAEKVTSARKILWNLQETRLHSIASLVVLLAKMAATGKRGAAVVAAVETDEVGAVDAAVVAGDVLLREVGVAQQLVSHLQDVALLELDDAVARQHRDQRGELRGGDALAGTERGAVVAAVHQELQVVVEHVDARGLLVALQRNPRYVSVLVVAPLGCERGDVELLQCKLRFLFHCLSSLLVIRRQRYEKFSAKPNVFADKLIVDILKMLCLPIIIHHIRQRRLFCLRIDL